MGCCRYAHGPWCHGYGHAWWPEEPGRRRFYRREERLQDLEERQAELQEALAEISESIRQIKERG